MQKTVLLIATFDTKGTEAFFLKEQIEALGCAVLTLDAGILAPAAAAVDIDRAQVARRGGTEIETALAAGDKGASIVNMMKGAAAVTRELYEAGRFQAVVAIGGAQGTDIATAAMRALPTGVPKFMVSTVASGQTPFGPFVGTKDIIMMHSVADIQGLNFLTRRILKNAAGAVTGMLAGAGDTEIEPLGIPAAMSMMGTTTPGALYCKRRLEEKGFEIVTFHQNGTGGAAMEEMIRSGAFRAVLDLSLHEVADRFMGGLHGAIRPDRLEAGADSGLPQVIVPGGINYMVLGPLAGLPAEIRARKLIVHNPNLTLVRLTPAELTEVGRIVAEKLNRCRGACRVLIPLRGFSYPDRQGLAHWEPEGNRAFTDSLKTHLTGSIPVDEVDAHINDPEFMDPVIRSFLEMFAEYRNPQRS